MDLVFPKPSQLQPETPPSKPRAVAEDPELVEDVGKGHGRLKKELRDAAHLAAQSGDVMVLLGRAALAGAKGRTAVARGLADLAATGRMASFALHAAMAAHGAALVDQVVDAASKLPSAPAHDDALLLVAAKNAVERATLVMKYLAASETERAAMRKASPELEKWIALSGEDDAPHRPVNIDTIGEGTVVDRKIVVPWMGKTVEVTLRLYDAGPKDAKTAIIFLHGHASRFEEYADVIPKLTPKYRVIAFDLPSSGYSQRISSSTIAPYPVFAADPKVPLLSFYDALVEAVATTLGIDRAYVAGGSLGGNLALRAQKRRRARPKEMKWLAGAVAWSPGSVWTSNRADMIKALGLDKTLTSALEEEMIGSRRDFFDGVFKSSIPFSGKTQPEMWYRDDWKPYKQWMIEASDAERRETYGHCFRIWHWLVAREQLVYSHVQPFEAVPAPLLLLAGEADNYAWTEIFNATQSLAKLLRTHAPTTTPGTAVFPASTGHSIHNERPSWLAERIAQFIG